ncbi:MAG TPA: TetR/AcrR family transcriptional regulator [Microthrixaceae bacterium]|nr:TetR/AcrR family transcriptional regulator [Microthrixaceae bacterium]
MGEERLTEEQGRQLLLEAAVKLALDTGGPNFTVRQVAARAGLNHGLVHRYFGTKDALISAVIKSIGADLAREMHDTRQQVGLVTDDRAHVLALLLVHNAHPDRADKTAVVGIQPVVDELVAASLGNLGDSLLDPKTQAALKLATILGWVVNEPLITQACGLRADQRDDLVSSIESLR